MSRSFYWIGKSRNPMAVWEDFYSGQEYEEKFNQRAVHVIKFTFRKYESFHPLFNHDAIYQTIRAYFHEVKLACFTREEHLESVPLFLYEISRGSEKWSFLGELRQSLVIATTLSDELALGQVIENYDRKIDFINKHFPNAIGTEEFFRFMRANSAEALDIAVLNLLQQNLTDIEVSKEPYNGDADSVDWVSFKRSE